jgi:hypothetical protein
MVMRGTVAKRIRRKVYGEMSMRNRAYYLVASNRHKPKKRDMVICDRLRNLYQRTKAIFKSLNVNQKRRLKNE